ncbi:hypothetical protein [Cupriavidus gilardii]|uniref:hypothetical protein n=1 Tax=Cupriavidus gilardii TaxID=82541 RepID=UPI0021B2A297|nr:hypothetical protein [Cupriavidus gilardii]UXC36639.1 hypothetical protein N4G38_04015 [Cupriavidus gilardii]
MLNLWDRQLNLLNGTSIPYRNLTIPACTPCNNVILSKLENELAASLPGGAGKVRALGHETLFVWLAKIFFGILYAEALLPINRALIGSGPIVPPNVLQGFDHLHFLMQAARVSFEFQSPDTKYHSTVLVFPVQQHPRPEHRFNYHDDIEYGCAAIRVDTIGLIYVADGGVQERVMAETMPAVFHHHLHPLQFEEIAAGVFTKARSLNRTPKYISSKRDGGVLLLQMPIAGMSTKPIFGEFDRDTYVRMLAAFTNMPLEVISPGAGKVMTWLGDPQRPNVIDVREKPWP